MSRPSRAADLWLLGGGYAAVAAGVWAVGVVTDSPLTRFVGFMAGASTFVPLPADAYVIAVSTSLAALTIGVVGGGVNALAVLVERIWVLGLMRRPSFDRVKAYVRTNRWIGLAARWQFIGLLVGGFSFLPFEPFRLLAVMTGYSRIRYALATAVGRGLRYYWLARAGRVFDRVGIVDYVVWATLALFVIGVVRSYRHFAETADEASDDVGGRR